MVEIIHHAREDNAQSHPPEKELDSIKGMIPIDTDNVLVGGALPLLALINAMERLESPASISGYYDCILRELQHYENKVQHPDIKQAALILAATLDELTMATSWGDSSWVGETLCSRLFNRRDAGKYAFEIIDECLKCSDKHMELLFLSFICIKFGFKGQFSHGKREALNSLQVNLYHLFIKNGLLQKLKLGFKSPQTECQPLKTFPCRRSLLFFLGALVFLFITGGTWIFSQKNIGIVSLEDARNVTSQPSEGYQLSTMENIHEFLFNKNY
ncbi:type IVB secretion system protein IcmH/DotU [Endozoicomonas sp.]|uniref:type IVB secretion system protein IcmH/DotU n=1 Tax=Endozoicomonas sp. TaxID=1892382 RepID=UPI0028847FAD|nr:type IVB secretion system protein IcmH/DotU [Endozoicomonas sp.]